jgi:hypothetical protein
MSVFCHPKVSEPLSPLRRFLNLDPAAELVFGAKPRVPTVDGRIDRTEVDLQVGDLLIEAKLTEGDFQFARWEAVRRYRDFEAVFDPTLLPERKGKLEGYQLVRGILGALAEEATRFCLLCDARRPDLIASWYRVVSAMRSSDRHWRCCVLTWQELVHTLPPSLRLWLREKYGIIPVPTCQKAITMQSF